MKYFEQEIFVGNTNDNIDLDNATISVVNEALALFQKNNNVKDSDILSAEVSPHRASTGSCKVMIKIFYRG